MAQVTVKDLSFSYPESSTRALDHVSFTIEPGQFVVLFGKTGCGKTTLLRHLKPALVPHGQTEGGVWYRNAPLQDLDAYDGVAHIGFVMQDPDAQMVTDQVWHELAFGLENLGQDQNTMRLRVAEIASYFGMQDWFGADIAQLSGGQKQLLALASVLTMRPDVLILDEPTSQLDPISASEFLVIVRRINNEFGTTVILSEHRLEEVYAHADLALAMDGGKLAAKGTPREVAEQLLSAQHELSLSLPTPARVAWALKQEGAVAEDANVDNGAEPNYSLPLSTAEGRAWLLHTDHTDAATHKAAKTLQRAHAIEVKDVWFRYERDGYDVLRSAACDIEEQTTFAFLGANGVGKSTLLKIICGAEKPVRGSVKLFGKKLEQWKRSDLFSGTIALLPQDPTTLFVKKTVQEELEEMFASTSAGVDTRHRMAEVSELCQIRHLHACHPLDLSGGEAQRVALAKVLMRSPRIVLLDEPTKGIDAVYKRALAQLFEELKASGTTIVLASHDVEFCARYADTVALLFNGEIAAGGPPREFFAQASYYTTAAHRMSRGMVKGAVLEEDIIEACITKTTK